MMTHHNGTKRHSRALLKTLLAGAAVATFLQASPAMAQSVRIDIDAKPLAKALQEFSRKSGRELLFSPSLTRGKSSRAVDCTCKAEVALSRLLQGTGLRFRLTSQDAFLVQKAGAGNDQSTSGQGIAPAERDQTDSQPASSAGELIIVTGSRLPQTNLTADNPVRVVDAELIKVRGSTNVGDTLAETPGVQIDQFSRVGTNSNNPGFQSLSLRGLGSERTLTLINGRRQVSGQIGTTAVDLSTIPNSLVERVEIVTGGGSSVYGTDAVAGVVNLITKTDFDGLDVGGTFRITDEGDGETFQGHIVYGKNFDDGRGNITTSFEYTNDSPALAKNRGFIDDLTLGISSPAGTQFLSGITRSAQSSAGVLLYNTPIVRTSLFTADDRLIIDDGSVTGTAGNALAISADGQSIIAFNPGTVLLNGLAQDGDGTQVRPTDSEFIGAENERYVATFNLNYELSPDVTAFIETKYVNRSTRTFRAPANGFFGTTISNPFLPAGITPQLLLAQDPFIVPPFPGFPPLPPLPAIPNEVFVGKTFENVGPITSDQDTEVYTGAIGLKGNFSDDLRWEVFVTHGRTELDERELNNLNAANLNLAANATTDSTGAVVCADPDFMTPQNEAVQAGCIPFNIFGTGPLAADALQFISSDLSVNTVQKQTTVGAFLGGRAFDLPAGPVNFSVGYTYREDSTNSLPSADFQAGVGIQTSSRRPVSGKISVHEAFGEVGIPILNGQSMAERLDLSLSASIADYDTVGTVGAYKVSGAWEPTRGLTFRGSYARAVRAPNINEAFPLEGVDFQPFPQPCGPIGINLVAPDPTLRAANCASDLGAANVPVLAPSMGISVARGANQNLTEETSNTFTVGLVLQPVFAPGLSVTIDYYDVEIRDAITTVDPFAIFAGCYDQSDFPGLTCDQFETDPATNLVTRVFVQPINVEALQTSGIDIGLNYTTEVGNIFGAGEPGRIDIRYNGLIDLEGIEFSLAQPDGEELVGIGARPDYEHTLSLTYSAGPASLFTNWRFRGPSDGLIGGSGDFGSRSYFDATLNYQFNRMFNATLGVTNLTDKEPRLQDSASANIDDFLGRTFFIRLGVSL